MKKLLVLFAVTLISFSAFAQNNDEGFKFTVVKENPVTSVKNQASTGTCWCFSSLSFIESEAIRINKLKEADYPDLSEMFVVSHAYADKAKKYIRVDGALNFAQGSSFGDLIYVLRDYGIVPNEVMPGLNYGTDTPATNLAIMGLFKHLSDSETAALEADGYKKENWGIDLVNNEDEYSKYLFYDYDYTKAPIYLWPFTPNVMATGGFTNGYGFAQE